MVPTTVKGTTPGDESSTGQPDLGGHQPFEMGRCSRTHIAPSALVSGVEGTVYKLGVLVAEQLLTGEEEGRRKKVTDELKKLGSRASDGGLLRPDAL